MKNHRKVSLCVEELESRLVPSQGNPWPYPTSNWSGYSIDTAANAVTEVQGSWTVPKVTVSGTGTKYAATWVGIDGDNSNTVEQIGTDSDQVNGKAVYYAWYEMYPAYPVYLDGKGNDPYLPISQGDSISAEVTNNGGGAFVLEITDNTSGKSVLTNQTLKSAQASSAEWIMEAPSSGWSVLPLANFGSETFTNAQATINGKTGSIGAFLQGDSSTVVYQIDIASYNRRTHTYKLSDATGPLSDATGLPTITDSFTVNYGATAPPAPANGPTTILGPMERLADLQVTVPVAVTPAGSSSSLAVVEISPATPGVASTMNPVPANETTVQPGSLARAAFFSQPEGTLSQSFVVGTGMAVGEGHTGAGLSWFGLPPVPGAAVPLAVTPVHGNAMAGGVRSESSAEPFVTAWLPIGQPAMAPPSSLVFTEDAHMDRLVGALALVAALPGLRMPREKEKSARPFLPETKGKPLPE